jgi:Heparinase II/III-like protein/Heparinase II/III N-terminus
MIPYEDLLNVDPKKVMVSARKIMKTGWALGNYPVLSLDEPIPWALESQQERSWNFHIHSWDMLEYLLKAHSQSQETDFLRLAVRLAEDWAEKHSDRAQTDVSSFAWYDMAVGLRAYRFAYILDAGQIAGLLDETQRKKLWASLEQHQAYLADDKNIQFHNNHGYFQIAGQLAMGRRFAGELPVMAEALEQGRARLKIMLAQQFGKDGIHREHSPDYHRMVYETLTGMINSGLVDDEETIAFADTIERALSWFVLPSRHIVNLGDSDSRLLAVSPSEAERKWRTPEMRAVVTGGALGQLPSEPVAVFPDSGYAVVRVAAVDAPLDFSKSSYLAQTAAFHSRTHKHADDLSFVWSDRGSALLVDAGRYGYIGKLAPESELGQDGHWYSDPNRIYCETTRAHNCLEFDGKNYPRTGVKPYGSALRRWTQAASGIVALETECTYFGSIRHVRVLLFLPSRWLAVVDWFHDNAEQPHDVKQWFHLAPQLSAMLQGGRYEIPVPGSSEPLRAISLLDGPVSSRLYCGEKDPVMQGWWSGKEREMIPSYAFCYERSQLATGAFATLFGFSNHLAAETTWNHVDVSGCQAQFRWKDEQRTHELRLDWSESGALNVDHTSAESSSNGR